MDNSKFSELCSKIKENVSKVIIGKDTEIDLILISLICQGHILLEDMPGTGKTLLAKSIARSFDCTFKRIQFTPDLLPSDLTGINYYNMKESEFEFRTGAVFANIVLADEINRATPKTQSGLLEAMEEVQVTVDGATMPLPKPFIVIATQNPVETQGTFPLPEAQLDRFLIKLKMNYPSREEGIDILKRFDRDNPFDVLEPVAGIEDILFMQEEYKNVFVHPDIMDYIIRLTEKTRSHGEIILGVSPRGSLALMRTAKAYAALKGRSYVIPDDITSLFKYVYGHRLILKASARLKDNAVETITDDILSMVNVPTEAYLEG